MGVFGPRHPLFREVGIRAPVWGQDYCPIFVREFLSFQRQTPEEWNPVFLLCLHFCRGSRETPEPKAANGGGKTYRAIWGGGGGKRTIECALQNQFWRPQKVGFASSVPASSKEKTGRKQKGGGKTYHRWGGPKPFLERGFMVCFPLP